jgi:hypothetical protein
MRFLFSEFKDKRNIKSNIYMQLPKDDWNSRMKIWTKIQFNITTNTSRRFQEGSYLRILRVTREDDTGPFQCIATNVTSGFSLQSGEASLNIHV